MTISKWRLTSIIFPIPAKWFPVIDRMPDLHKRRTLADTQTRKQLDMYIAQTDSEIDALVYELYDVTEEERKIVEGSKK